MFSIGKEDLNADMVSKPLDAKLFEKHAVARLNVG